MCTDLHCSIWYRWWPETPDWTYSSWLEKNRLMIALLMRLQLFWGMVWGSFGFAGYKCNWNEAVWPPKCAVQSFTDPAKICISGKCANDACWWRACESAEEWLRCIHWHRWEKTHRKPAWVLWVCSLHIRFILALGAWQDLFQRQCRTAMLAKPWHPIPSVVPNAFCEKYSGLRHGALCFTVNITILRFFKNMCKLLCLHLIKIMLSTKSLPEAT